MVRQAKSGMTLLSQLESGLTKHMGLSPLESDLVKWMGGVSLLGLWSVLFGFVNKR